MSEMMETVLSTWKQYWGGGYYPYLLLAAAVYLLIFHRDKKPVRGILAFSAVMLALFFFPPSAWVLTKCVGEDVYWRVLWVLPGVPLLASAGAELVQKAGKNLLLRTALIVCLAALPMFCGKSVWKAGNYEKVHNFQKVPDEVAQICDTINSLKEEGETVCVAADDYISSYIRVYDPSITMPYSRGRKGAANKAARKLYRAMESGDPRPRRIARLAKKTGCNYLVHKLLSEEKQAKLEKRGYRLVATVNDYGIYKAD